MKIFMQKISRCIATTAIIGLTGALQADQTLISKKVATPPSANVEVEDPIWQQAEEVVTRDSKADISITLKSVHTDSEIFFQVSFPDATENRTHKDFIWNEQMRLYEQGNNREDVFVFKWSMDSETSDLSLSSDQQYTADIWFWKAARTDPSGFADDKFQIYSAEKRPKSKILLSKSGKPFYLARMPDEGSAAYANRFYDKFQGERVLRYGNVHPSGSRADIKAKGKWANGRWTILFSRKLVTGHSDDVQFKTRRAQINFGVSRFEMAGRESDPKLDQPEYGSGDVSENLSLLIEE